MYFSFKVGRKNKKKPKRSHSETKWQISFHFFTGKKSKEEIPRPPVVVKQEKDTFYLSRRWRELRYKAIKRYGGVCMACKVPEKAIHVDHIKPRSKFPDLQWELSNLQVLCAECNIGKSNIDSTDWRK